MSATMTDLLTDDEDYTDETLEWARELLREARKLEPRNEAIEKTIVQLGKRMKEMVDNLSARYEEVAGLESQIREMQPVADAAHVLVEKTYDVGRRLITPNELVQYVRGNFEEDGEPK